MIHVGTKLKDSPKIGQFPWALESAYVMQRVHIMGSLWCLRRLRRESDLLDHVSRLWSSPVEFFVPILNANSVDIWQSKHQRRIRSYETWMEIDKVSALSRIFEKYFTLNLFRFLRDFWMSEFNFCLQFRLLWWEDCSHSVLAVSGRFSNWCFQFYLNRSMKVILWTNEIWEFRLIQKKSYCIEFSELISVDSAWSIRQCDRLSEFILANF